VRTESLSVRTAHPSETNPPELVSLPSPILTDEHKLRKFAGFVVPTSGRLHQQTRARWVIISRQHKVANPPEWVRVPRGLRTGTALAEAGIAASRSGGSG
jgi:hypothetical protein